MTLPPEIRRDLLAGLGRLRGDDLYRARAAFRGMSATQMAEQHGQSGRTRQEILAEYEEHDVRIQRAIDWVVAQ